MLTKAKPSFPATSTRSIMHRIMAPEVGGTSPLTSPPLQIHFVCPPHLEHLP